MFKKLLIAGDNHAAELSAEVLQTLAKMGVSALSFETKDGEDYIAVGKRAIKEFETNSSLDGLVLICGTGVGMAMLANRFSFLRAVLATNSQTAYFARRHENANCLCLAGGYTDGKIEVEKTKNVKKILETFLKTEFEGGRHKTRAGALSKLGE